MKKLKFIFRHFLAMLTFVCFFSITTNAQIISVAPGTDFNVKSGTTMVADRVDFNFSGDFSLTGNTLNVDLVPAKISGISIMQRVYRFTNTVYYMAAKIGLNYRENELNGIGESDLSFLYNNTTGWVSDINSVLNAGNNLLESGALNYTKLDAFTAGKYLATDELIVVRANPNPSATEFNVTVLAKGQTEIDITVIDIRGAIIETQKTRPYQTIKLGRNYPQGTYVIRAVQGNKPIAAIRVVKL